MALVGVSEVGVLLTEVRERHLDDVVLSLADQAHTAGALRPHLWLAQSRRAPVPHPLPRGVGPSGDEDEREAAARKEDYAGPSQRLKPDEAATAISGACTEHDRTEIHCLLTLEPV